MRCYILVGFIACGLAVGPDPARAGSILFSTFGPNDAYSSSGAQLVVGTGYPTGYRAMAMNFTPSATSLLGSVKVAVDTNYTGGQGINVELYSNAGTDSQTPTHPGSRIELLGTVLFGPSASPGPETTIADVSSSAHTELFAGTQYWLVLTPSPSNEPYAQGWNFAPSYVYGPKLFEASTSTNPDDPATPAKWSVGSSEDGAPLSAFEIDGQASTTPEPSSLILCGMAGISFAGYGWRRKRALSTLDHEEA